MQARILGLIVVGAMFLALAACGGAQESRTEKLVSDVDPNVDPVAELSGINDKTQVAVEKEAPPEQPAAAEEKQAVSDEEAIEGTNGAFVAKLILNGKETEGKITVKTADANPTVVEENVPVGKEISLKPGRYDFTITSQAITGAPEQTLRDVDIPSGRRIKREIKIPVGQITLVTGANCVRKAIRIKQKGATDWYKGKFTTCEAMTLMAGEYEAEMVEGRTGTPISGIQVYDGGIREVLIRSQK
ncbi:MAG: hypothetical protein PHU25_11210 [Deltaproteobacteria bacterium]|nr:hypothetical protein [Deltaproteobacteria bacterium]